VQMDCPATESKEREKKQARKGRRNRDVATYCCPLLPAPKAQLGYPEIIQAELKIWKAWGGGRRAPRGCAGSRGQEEKQQKASRRLGGALCVAQGALWTLNHSCLAFLSSCACRFVNTGCLQHRSLAQKCCSWTRLFPVGMRGRKLGLITYNIQPEMLAAKGTKGPLQKNAWIQPSKHALAEECCPGGWLRSSQVAQQPPSQLSACPARVRVRAPAGGDRALPKSWGMLWELCLLLWERSSL